MSEADIIIAGATAFAVCVVAAGVWLRSLLRVLDAEQDPRD